MNNYKVISIKLNDTEKLSDETTRINCCVQYIVANSEGEAAHIAHLEMSYEETMIHILSIKREPELTIEGLKFGGDKTNEEFLFLLEEYNKNPEQFNKYN